MRKFIFGFLFGFSFFVSKLIIENTTTSIAEKPCANLLYIIFPMLISGIYYTYILYNEEEK